MKTPFGHARKTRKNAENIVVKLNWDGFEGYGEGVPRDYVTGETPISNMSAITSLNLKSICEQIDLSSFERSVLSVESLDLPTRLMQNGKLGLAASCAVELALLDSIGRRFERPISDVPGVLDLPKRLFGQQAKHPTVIALSSNRTIEDLKKFPQLFSIVKIKVGLGQERDLENLKNVREAYPDLIVSVDGNMAWDLPTAIKMVKLMEPYGVAWFEEPMKQGAYSDYAELKQKTGANIMLDESLCSMKDALTSIDKKAVDYFNVRLSKCGGLIPSLRLMALADKHDLKIQQGMHPGELSILRAAEWNLASVLGCYSAIEAAFTGAQFDEEISEELLEMTSVPRLKPLEGPGLGIHVVDSRLEDITEEKFEWQEGATWRRIK